MTLLEEEDIHIKKKKERKLAIKSFTHVQCPQRPVI